MKHITLFLMHITVLIIFCSITVTVQATALKLTNRTTEVVFLDTLQLQGIPLFSQEKTPKFPVTLNPDESFFYDAGTAGFQSITLSVENKDYLKKTFKVNIAGIEAFHLWEIFLFGSEEKHSEKLVLMGTGGILK